MVCHGDWGTDDKHCWGGISKVVMNDDTRWTTSQMRPRKEEEQEEEEVGV